QIAYRALAAAPHARRFRLRLDLLAQEGLGRRHRRDRGHDPRGSPSARLRGCKGVRRERGVVGPEARGAPHREEGVTREEIPDEVRRFVQPPVPPVPFAEALLLFIAAHGGELETLAVARRLYISEPAALALVEELRAAGVIAPGKAAGA